MINKEQFKIIRENEGSLKIASNDAALLNVCLIIYVTYFHN